MSPIFLVTAQELATQRWVDPTIWPALGAGQAETLAAALRKGPNELKALAESKAIKGFTMQWVNLIDQVTGSGYELGMAHGLEVCAGALQQSKGLPGRCKFHLDYLTEYGNENPVLTSYGVETCWGQRHKDGNQAFWTYPYCVQSAR